MSPVLAGGFFATEPPGKPCLFLFSMWMFVLHNCLFSFVLNIVAVNVKRAFPPNFWAVLYVSSRPSPFSLGGRDLTPELALCQDEK